jgi:predicted nucleic acid-binding protein
MQPPGWSPVDSNILLALAEDDDEAVDAWEVIRTRLRPVMLIVSPTVLDEVGYKAAQFPPTELQPLAAKALRELRSRWMLQPVDLRSDQEALVALVGKEIALSGLLPFAERNDTLVLAEAAVLECALLVSKDSHLHQIDRTAVKNILAGFDLPPLLIASPREIVKKFCR